MNRVYLLLRDNSQTGPYTFDELLQQQLQPSDLIWVEGLSVAWAYPCEIEDLRKSFSGQAVEPVTLSVVKPVAAVIEKPVTAEKVDAIKDQPALIPVTRPKKPKDEIEKRAEELRKKALAFSQYAGHTPTPVLHATDEFRPYLTDKDAVQFVHHNSRRSAPIGEILVAAMMMGLIVLGWYGGANKYFVISKKQVPATTVATQLVASDMHAAARSIPEQPVNIVDSITNSDSTVIANTGNYSTAATAITPAKKTYTSPADSQDIDAGKPVVEENTAVVPEKNEQEKPVDPVKTSVQQVPDNKETADKKPAVDKKETEPKKDSTETSKQSAQPEAEDADEKKKSLGTVLKGIFKKKKKD